MTIRVACAVVIFEEKILVTQRSKNMSQPYKWEFPGGKIETHESDTQCIIREIMEELNIRINITGKLNDCEYDDGKSKIALVPFLAEYVSGSLTLIEHMNYDWLHFDQLNIPDWAPADVGVLQNLTEVLQSVYLKS